MAASEIQGRRASRTNRERRDARWTAARWERRLLTAAAAARRRDDYYIMVSGKIPYSRSVTLRNST